MRLHGDAIRLTILIGENDSYGRRPLANEIVQRARKTGFAGATVLRGIQAFGTSSRVKTSSILDLSQDLPIAIIVVDTRDRIDAFLPELITEGVIFSDPVQVIRYVGRGARPETK